MTITTGPPKKRETYARQAAENQDTNRQAQAARNEWKDDTREESSSDDSNRP